MLKLNGAPTFDLRYSLSYLQFVILPRTSNYPGIYDGWSATSNDQSQHRVKGATGAECLWSVASPAERIAPVCVLLSETPAQVNLMALGLLVSKVGQNTLISSRTHGPYENSSPGCSIFSCRNDEFVHFRRTSNRLDRVTRTCRVLHHESIRLLRAYFSTLASDQTSLYKEAVGCLKVGEALRHKKLGLAVLGTLPFVLREYVYVDALGILDGFIFTFPAPLHSIIWGFMGISGLLLRCSFQPKLRRITSPFAVMFPFISDNMDGNSPNTSRNSGFNPPHRQNCSTTSTMRAGVEVPGKEPDKKRASRYQRHPNQALKEITRPCNTVDGGVFSEMPELLESKDFVLMSGLPVILPNVVRDVASCELMYRGHTAATFFIDAEVLLHKNTSHLPLCTLKLGATLPIFSWQIQPFRLQRQLTNCCAEDLLDSMTLYDNLAAATHFYCAGERLRLMYPSLSIFPWDLRGCWNRRKTTSDKRLKLGSRPLEEIHYTCPRATQGSAPDRLWPERGGGVGWRVGYVAGVSERTSNGARRDNSGERIKGLGAELDATAIRQEDAAASVHSRGRRYENTSQVIRVSMEQRWNEGVGEMGDPREDPPTYGIALVGGEQANCSTTVAPFLYRYQLLYYIALHPLQFMLCYTRARGLNIQHCHIGGFDSVAFCESAQRDVIPICPYWRRSCCCVNTVFTPVDDPFRFGSRRGYSRMFVFGKYCRLRRWLAGSLVLLPIQIRFTAGLLPHVCVLELLQPPPVVGRFARIAPHSGSVHGRVTPACLCLGNTADSAGGWQVRLYCSPFRFGSRRGYSRMFVFGKYCRLCRWLAGSLVLLPIQVRFTAGLLPHVCVWEILQILPAVGRFARIAPHSGSVHGGVTPACFCVWEILQTLPVVDRFARIAPHSGSVHGGVTPAFARIAPHSGSVHGGVTPACFCVWEILQTLPVVDRFARIAPHSGSVHGGVTPACLCLGNTADSAGGWQVRSYCSSFPPPSYSAAAFLSCHACAESLFVEHYLTGWLGDLLLALEISPTLNTKHKAIPLGGMCKPLANGKTDGHLWKRLLKHALNSAKLPRARQMCRKRASGKLILRTAVEVHADDDDVECGSPRRAASMDDRDQERCRKRWDSGRNVQQQENIRRLIDNARFSEDRPKPRPKRVWTEEQRRAYLMMTDIRASCFATRKVKRGEIWVTLNIEVLRANEDEAHETTETLHALCVGAGEWDLWTVEWKNSKDELLKDAITALMKCEETLFPNLHILLEILATLPLSTASVERSFSTLKRLKTYLRNSTGEDRLNRLAVISIHRYAYHLNDYILLGKFAKNRRMLVI
ncbi:hypothetical protein PR048_010111 [Dryococelus australis]|uniref:HAT C-terminal dimerisation domain-containing protein n=1 Tax=Dryococelus australis TaxID=614101 RepID=A0ABQ9I275_9NEOP|nr:hypothetical protein PR048_010111 [Dryococelus australis]